MTTFTLLHIPSATVLRGHLPPDHKPYNRDALKNRWYSASREWTRASRLHKPEIGTIGVMQFVPQEVSNITFSHVGAARLAANQICQDPTLWEQLSRINDITSPMPSRIEIDIINNDTGETIPVIRSKCGGRPFGS